MQNLIKYFLLVLIIISPFSSYSTHIVGGEINYIYLGNNNYEIHATMYRDCFNGIPPFDNPASFGIFDVNNNLISSLLFNLTSTQILNPSPTNCFSVVPPNICYEMGTYVFSVTLPPIPGGYQLAYQRCCRQGFVINIDNVEATGATFSASIPDSAFASNSNPIFNNVPFTFLCVNDTFTFDNSASDSDGDSIVYSLSDPLAGASSAIPLPVPPSNPPYQSINWLPPYSLSNIMGGVPLQIDPQTGILSGTPNATGVFAFNVSAKEYRNGQYLGETRRDFEVYVINNVGIAEIEEGSFICSPNPFHDRMTITIPDRYNFQEVELVLYNVLGEKVRTISDMQSNEIIIERNELNIGMYFYQILNNGKMLGEGKLAVE